MGDRTLDYIALIVLFFVIVTLIYGVIYIHDIPYEIAKKRKHPHQDAIHTAGWVSLFLMHTIWPFLWIWATLYKEGVGWGISYKPDESSQTKFSARNAEQLKDALSRIEKLEKQEETLRNAHVQNIKALKERISKLEQKPQQPEEA